MKKSKKLLCGALTMAMVLSSFAGCSGSSNNTTSTDPKNLSETSATLDKMAEPVTLKYFLYENAGWPLKNDTPVLNKIFKETNVKIDYTIAPASDPQSKFNTMMISGELPDLVWNDAKVLEEYGKKGYFLDLSSFIEKKMPNVHNEIQKSDFAKKTLYTPEGKIYAIPRLGQDKNSIAWLIRQDWLDKLDLKKPETLDDWVDVLTQFKEKNPGKVDPEKLTPLVLRNGSATFLSHAEPAFGMHWAVYSKNPKDNSKYVLNATLDNYKQELQWFNNLYNKKLLDREFPTCDTTRWEQYMTSSFAGATIDYGVRADVFTNALQKSDKNAKMVACVPPAGPNGDRGIPCYSDALLSYSVAISEDCENVDAACVFLNYLYSEKGSWLSSCGIDGVTYNDVDENGVANWIDEIKNNPNDMAITAKYGIQQPSCARLIHPNEYKIIFGPLTQEGMALNAPYYVDPYVPGIYTDELSEEDGELGAVVHPIISEQSTKFIVGQRSFDEWDSFQKELKDAGIDRMGEIFTEAQASIK